MNETTMKTFRETLMELPEPHRTAALRNCGKSMLETPCGDSVSAAVAGAFIWDTTPEGHDFWSGVRQALLERRPLPPIPATN